MKTIEGVPVPPSVSNQTLETLQNLNAANVQTVPDNYVWSVEGKATGWDISVFFENGKPAAVRLEHESGERTIYLPVQFALALLDNNDNTIRFSGECVLLEDQQADAILFLNEWR